MTAIQSPKIPVAIVGARGYSGLELARILLQHPRAELKACFATDAQFSLAEELPELEGLSAAPALPISELKPMASELDTVFLATPAEASLKLAPELLAAGANVIDLSGAFRLTAEGYAKHYGAEHTAPELLAQAEYGLVPWAGPSRGKKPHLIANPGCYATSVLMALIPLIRERLIAADSIVIDAKSGTSGAGKKAAEHLLFTEVEGECLPYRVGRHQHLPEIQKYVEAFAGLEIEPFFSTSLLNVRRGIISGIYVKLSESVAKLTHDEALKRIVSAFNEAYSGYGLVRHSALPIEDGPAARKALSLKRVVGSSRVHIRYQLVGNRLYLFSLIDNLMKGAASQAVENFNRLQDLRPETSLTEMEGTL